MRTRWLWVAAPVLAGCVVGPDFRRPAAPEERTFVAERPPPRDSAPDTAQRLVEGLPVDASWWRLFRCPKLEAIVTQALAASPGVEAARATLRRNQESLRAGYGVFFPQLDAHAGASRQLYNPAPGSLPSNTFNLFTLSGTVSYAIDLWGGERRQVEVLQTAVEAQRDALLGTQVILASNVVDALIAQAAYRAEIDATREMVLLLREQTRISGAQASAGTVPYANVLSIESQEASTETLLPPLAQKLDQASDLLAELSGATPASWTDPALTLADLSLPADLPVSLPSQLVRQRADILIAEAELHAANASIGVATAAMFPSITLSASYGSNATTGLGDLFGVGTAFWSVGAGLTQPVFHGGTLYHQRQAAIAARDAAAAEYRETVLSAFEQVADTLRGLKHDGEAVAAQARALEAAEKALRLVQANYQAGIATYLQVLNSDVLYLQARLGTVEATAQRLQDTVALFVALGGGWWNEPPAPASTGRATGPAP